MLQLEKNENILFKYTFLAAKQALHIEISLIYYTGHLLFKI